MELIVDKLVAIWDLVSGCSRLTDVKAAVSNFADFVYKLPDVPPHKKAQLEFARLQRVNYALYMGYEGRPVFSFFNRSEVGGIKSTFMDTSITPRAPRRARQIIDGLIASKTLTPKGLNFLTMATDPFHDVPLEPAGFPDINTVPSIVQVFTQTVSISAPTVTGTGPWECHVFFAPYSPPSTSTGALGFAPYPYNPTTGTIDATTALPAATLAPGYNILTGPPGTDWSVNPNWTNNSQGIYFPTTVIGGLFRIIAAGVEVVNTSAQLYKSGACTSYRAPSHRTCGTLNYQIGTEVPIIQTKYGDHRPKSETLPVTTIIPATFIEMPPTSQSLAQLYPNSRTWAAEEGYYGIGTLTDADNDYQPAIVGTLVALQPPSNAALAASTSQPAWIWGSGNGKTHFGRPLPMDCHGVVATGLNALSTLQVTTRYIIERIPCVYEPQLLVLTRPCSPYDPVALEIYSRTIASLPVGCMVKENPLGEWFTSILEAISSLAPVVGSAFGGPGAAIGTLASTAARAAARAIADSSSAPAVQPGQVLGQKAPQQRRRKPLPPTPARKNRKN